jgi:5S rRNA maturation endonuclease (ribonuclease M5)
MNASVEAFYHALGVELPAGYGTNVSIRCPFFPDGHKHGDANKSCSVNRDNGTWNCHGCKRSGGPYDAAIELGNEPREAMELLKRHGLAEDRDYGDRGVVGNYDYTDEEGNLLFQVVRYEHKKFKQRRPDGNGGFFWNLNGTRRVLYRFPKVLAALEKDEPIWIVEGEKDVHALESIGFTATCNPGGAGKWRPEYTEVLRDARVVVCPDADTTGRESARGIAKPLAGVAQVKVVDLEPTRTDGYDVSDFLSEARNEEERADARRALVRLAKAAAKVPSATATREVGTVAPSSKLRKLDVAHMVAEEAPPVPWRVEPVLADGALTMLFAPPGEGKSLLALTLAAGIALGEDVAGLPTRQGKVLYVDAENGAWEIHRRVKCLGLPAEGVALYEAASDFDLRREEAEVERLVSEEEATVLILDSLRSLAPGLDENDSGDCEAALAPLRRLAHERKLAVLLIHHANKGGQIYRGSSAIQAAVEITYQFGRVEDDPDPARRFLRVRKMRIGPEPQKRWLRLSVERGMVLVGGAEPYESESQTQGAPVRDELAPRILEAIRQPLRLADVARAVDRDPRDGTVRRVLERLEADGEAEKDESGLWKRCQGAKPPMGAGTVAPSEKPHGNEESEGATPNGMVLALAPSQATTQANLQGRCSEELKRLQAMGNEGRS